MEIDRRQTISIRDANLHNLKNFSCDFPGCVLSAVTGPWGSGKSTLVFDVLYGELRRRLLKSRHREAPLASVQGAGVALALTGRAAAAEMAVNASGVYSALTELFLNFGVQHCVKCSSPLSWLPLGRIIDRIESLPEGSPVRIQAPLLSAASAAQWTKAMLDRGLSRARLNGQALRLENFDPRTLTAADRLSVVVDAFGRKSEYSARIAEAAALAAELSGGVVEVAGSQLLRFSAAPRCLVCGTLNKKLGKRDFLFRRREAACPECAGRGRHFVFEVSRIFHRRDEKLNEAFSRLLPQKKELPAEISTLLEQAGYGPGSSAGSLPAELKERIVFGNGGERRLHAGGGSGISAMLREQYLKIKRKGLRERIENYCIVEECRLCSGTRLRAEVRQLTLGGKYLQDVLRRDFSSLYRWLQSAGPPADTVDRQRAFFETLLQDLQRRAQMMEQLAAGYLELFRPSSTLSSGEMQRALCVRQLSSPLSRILYLLDEPTRGLHPDEVRSLTERLKELVSRGNSVIAVEHDPDFVAACDYAIALGPGGGVNGGRLLAAGSPAGVLRTEAFRIGETKAARTQPAGVLALAGISKHNLKSINLEIPLGRLVVLCGASGSGKSTAAREVIIPVMKEILRRRSELLDESEKRYYGVARVEGAQLLRRVVDVDARSGSGGYGIVAGILALFEPLRQIYASTVDARMQGMQAKHFSFISPAGRCEECGGTGKSRAACPGAVCPRCGGARYAANVLEVRYRGRSIADSLRLTVDEALKGLTGEPRVRSALKTASALGLGYLVLGQELTSLSSGERQRASMVPYLSARSLEKTLFVFDEPSAGLSIAEEGLLISLLHALVERGASVLAVDHSLRLISAAQHIIELGPGGGEEGGRIIAQGSPEEVKKSRLSRIAAWLA